MNATAAEKWISQKEISHKEIGNDKQIYDQLPKVESIEVSKISTIVDFFRVLLTGWQVPAVFIRRQGRLIDENRDACVARLEQEDNDFIERLKIEVRRIDANKVTHIPTGINASIKESF